MKYQHLNNINNMMSNIIAEGRKTVWDTIEEEKDALERCKKRKLYHRALQIIKKGK